MYVYKRSGYGFHAKNEQNYLLIFIIKIGVASPRIPHKPSDA